MTQRELKQKLYELANAYFSGATVVWGRTKQVQAKTPLLCLTMGGVNRPYQPMSITVNGVSIDCYPSSTTVQVDLFTKGAVINATAGTTAATENTAVSDLIDFVNFINSGHVGDWCAENDVSILANQVHDLTEIINDTSWEYRAMTELEIGFTQFAVGYTGINYENGISYYENGNPKHDADGNPLYPDGAPVPPKLDVDGNPIPWPPPRFEPTSSGGGDQSLADDAAGWFERAEIKIE